MIYFAYGANMDPPQMRLRCRNAVPAGIGRLDGFRLCFPRYSAIRQSAMASIEEAIEGSVWGLLYELGEPDLARLDICEGFFSATSSGMNTATRIEVIVRRPEGEAMPAFTYRAVPMAYAGDPSDDYLIQIVRAASAHGIPDDYLDHIRGWPRHAAAA